MFKYICLNIFQKATWFYYLSFSLFFFGGTILGSRKRALGVGYEEVKSSPGHYLPKLERAQLETSADRNWLLPMR